MLMLHTARGTLSIHTYTTSYSIEKRAMRSIAESQTTRYWTRISLRSAETPFFRSLGSALRQGAARHLEWSRLINSELGVKRASLTHCFCRR